MDDNEMEIVALKHRNDLLIKENQELQNRIKPGMSIDHYRDEVEKLEVRVGALVAENTQLREHIQAKNTRICALCNVDHVGVRGLMGQVVYACFECMRASRQKFEGVGRVQLHGELYGVVPIEVIKGSVKDEDSS